MSILDKARTWLPEMLQKATATSEVSGDTITYVRAADSSVTDLTDKAWLGASADISRPPNERGPSVEFGDQEFFIPVAELANEPARGDRIVHTSGGYATTYELMVTAGQPAWRYAEGREVYQVHTKRVSREVA